MINHDYDAVRYQDTMGKQKAWAIIKILAFYLTVFVMGMVVIRWYAFIGRTIILLFSIAMIVATLISHWLVAPERPNQMINIKRNLFMYFGILIGAYILITLYADIDPNKIGVSLGGSTGTTQNNAASGWIQMITQFLTFMPPIAHIGYEVNRIWTYYGFGHGRTTKRKRMEQLQKTIVR